MEDFNKEIQRKNNEKQEHILKSFDNNVEKGVYGDTFKNRQLNRVGQTYNYSNQKEIQNSEKKIRKTAREEFGGDPFESGARDARNGEDLGGADFKWVKKIQTEYPSEWKEYIKGFESVSKKETNQINKEKELENGKNFFLQRADLTRKPNFGEPLERAVKGSSSIDYDNKKEVEYFNSLPVKTQDHNLVPENNPDKITTPYILKTKQGSYFVDPEGSDYPRHMTRLKHFEEKK